MSRSAFAVAFKTLVDQPPADHLAAPRKLGTVAFLGFAVVLWMRSRFASTPRPIS